MPVVGLVMVCSKDPEKKALGRILLVVGTFFGSLLVWEALNCSLTGGCFSFFTIRRSQSNADSALIDLEAQTTVFVIFG